MWSRYVNSITVSRSFAASRLADVDDLMRQHTTYLGAALPLSCIPIGRGWVFFVIYSHHFWPLLILIGFVTFLWMGFGVMTCCRPRFFWLFPHSVSHFLPFLIPGFGNLNPRGPSRFPRCIRLFGLIIPLYRILLGYGLGIFQLRSPFSFDGS